MTLTIGIVGLPNAGKSTTFNALSQTQNAEVAEYPFCTIEPNRAVVPVPDPRLEQLQSLTGVPHSFHATITFVDIAGLVPGASRGEGLGNQFLAHIRETDAILHVVRCFEAPNVARLQADSDPLEDIQIVTTELCLADQAQLDRKIERLESEVKGDRDLLPRLETARQLSQHLGAGQPVRTFEAADAHALAALIDELSPLTAKPVIYAANVAELESEIDQGCVDKVRQAAHRDEAQVFEVRARLEADLAGSSDEERGELLEIAGLEHSGLQQIVRQAYQQLDLISFFTMNENEVRAWTVEDGATAYEAAGKIHTDFQRGFIRAEVCPFETLVALGSWAEARAAGKLQVEGRDYAVRDGDILLFRFNA
ncbi:MAG: redox-regulated ATPase YchF [Anaerolineales bacterium]